MQSSVCRRLGILGRGQTCALTCALRLPPGSPWLVPARPWTPPEMSSFGFGTLTVALFALVCCSGSDEKAFEVHVRPEKLIVEPKESLKVNCSTTCNQPEVGGLETSLNKILLAEQAQWKHYLISNISHDTVLWCHFTCSGKQESMSSNVSVYQPPKQVFLTLQPTWVAVGKSFTIECRVPAVEPLDRLTLFLLRGNETLHSQTFGKAAPALQEATATFSSTAHREDGHHNFSCLAELNLTSRGGDVFQKHSAPKMLEIYEPVPDSQMVIIVLVVSVLLFLFVTSVLLCFIFSQHWRQRRTGTYGVRAAWRRLPQAFRP
ncbi:PREDICTED: intercellular adhesion molecule 2 isoform X3 [Rhinopithecus bieti]|nr:PREDICTED: intercellular adhesion molecule 2 isoform X3 [Rhinopithecus bieti]